MNACKQMGFHLLFSRAEDRIQRSTHIHQVSSNFDQCKFLQCLSFKSVVFLRVRSVEQLTLDFQARLEALEEQKSLEASLGTVTQDSSSGQYAAAYFFLQRGCILNGLRIMATANVASYQLLEGPHIQNWCCQPDGGRRPDKSMSLPSAFAV